MIRELDLQLFAEGGSAQPDGAEQGAAAGGAPQVYTEEIFQQKLKEETEKLTAKYEGEFNAKLDAARQEAEKTARMTQDEKKKFEFEKKEKELLEKEQALALRELKAETAKLLAGKGLPAEVLEMVLANDAESTKKKVEDFKEVFDLAVQKAVEGRLQGTTPKGGSTGKTAAEQAREEFKRALGNY